MFTQTGLKSGAVQFVAVNAAFLQEVKEANSSVWDLLFALRQVAQKSTPTPPEIHQWVQNLTEFRRQLSTEFALEETYGYLSSIQPRCTVDVVDPGEVVRQHKDLYVQLLELCEEVEQSQYVGTVIRDFRNHTAMFQEFDASLSQHERIEAEMIRRRLAGQ